MKKGIFFVVLILTSCLNSFAQSSNESDKTYSSIADRFYVEFEASSAFKQHHVTPLSASINVGINITSRFYGFVRLETPLGLYKKDDNKAYFNSTNLGGGLGYTLFYEHNTKDYICLDLRASVTNSIGNVDWKNTTYDIGLYVRTRTRKSDITPYAGIGFRYINSHTNDIRDIYSPYIAVGLNF